MLLSRDGHVFAFLGIKLQVVTLSPDGDFINVRLKDCIVCGIAI